MGTNDQFTAWQDDLDVSDRKACTSTATSLITLHRCISHDDSNIVLEISSLQLRMFFFFHALHSVTVIVMVVVCLVIQQKPHPSYRLRFEHGVIQGLIYVDQLVT